MFSRKFTAILLTLILLLLLVSGVAWYLLKVKPLETEISNLEASIKAEKDLIDQYGVGKNKELTEEEIETISFQKRVPVVENMEQFLIILEEAEALSDSLILNINFSKSTEEAKDTEETTIEEDIESLEGSAIERNEKKTEENKNNTIPLPVGLQKITADLNIESDDFFELLTFIEKLEREERVITVESLQFSGFSEVTNISDFTGDLPTLTYNMRVSTYFYPELEELKAQAPKFEPKEPEEKKNPLFQSEIPKNIKEQIINTKIQPIEEIQDGVTYKVYSHNVVKDDNIFNIALSYYGSQDLEKGQNLILEWNGMDSEQDLQAGTTIKVPVPIKNENKVNESPKELPEELPEETVKNGITYKVSTHNVIKGDSLFNIALKYYGSKNLDAGQKLILDWNNMESERDLQAGLKIEIPIPVEEIMK